MDELDSKPKQSDIGDMKPKIHRQDETIQIRINLQFKKELQRVARDENFDSLTTWIKYRLKKIVDGKLK